MYSTNNYVCKGQNYDKHHKILPKIDTFYELIHYSTIVKII